MKVNFLTVATLNSFIYCAAGYTIVRANMLSEDVLAKAPPITFTGPAVPGGPDVTITGTVEVIFKKLHEMNPKYDPWEFPEYQEKMAQQGLSKNSTLEARGDKLQKRRRIECNIAGKKVGNWLTQCGEGVRYLRNLNGYCGAPKGYAGPACARVSCSNNCGIFLCNENNKPIKVFCGNLRYDFYEIVHECADVVRDWVVSLKGAIYRDGPPAWNTVVKFQTC
ncbi:hypothetical protein TWF569_011757 [Orbilia oligospora]|uniref:Secreted protein n=1 Tax=Orbilia oligospora TaxID=2813651 RepID=A0A7C8NCD1_ORBOL|nr:hypothetical protein TWF102_004452 [Orbilia oligospora]KAF3103765.1 hypothetical protein TWF706_004807 [Orbilia oligospora]KAF3110348.1 hypothetical protein TWF103_004638 [Orbilia oligospora]KAF3122501.1 hypothetical protein TWF594_002794 [Orbilia oligospora]KAF3127392.1 hypothetical protein TWF569_011757 [Orbilia oligospora]